MPVKPLRRLVAPTTNSLFDRLNRESLSCAWDRPAMTELEREHPKLILERNGNVLAAFREGSAALAYSFESDSAFCDDFPRMLEQLLPRLRRSLSADTVRFRLTHNSSRTAVEPVLRSLDFMPEPAWLRFSLDRATGVPAGETPNGIRFRAGTIDDVDEIARIDCEAFPDSPMGATALRRIVQKNELTIALAGKASVGFALHYYDGEGEAYLSILAVDDDHRGDGIGTALTKRVVKWGFAQGADHVALRTEERNSGAIRLYRRLGFVHVGSGQDYQRPTDPRVIAAMREAREGTFIKFGGWR